MSRFTVEHVIGGWAVWDNCPKPKLVAKWISEAAAEDDARERNARHEARQEDDQQSK